MNYTTNYHLPQWVKDDRIMMEDFNQMCADMESGLDSNARAAAQAAQAAEEARTEAIKLPYVTGTYVGTGERNRHIVVGFRPGFVLVGAPSERTSGGSRMDFFSGFSCGGILPNNLSFTDDGFIVNGPQATDFPHLNYKDYTYDYIAFR